MKTTDPILLATLRHALPGTEIIADRLAASIVFTLLSADVPTCSYVFKASLGPEGDVVQQKEGWLDNMVADLQTEKLCVDTLDADGVVLAETYFPGDVWRDIEGNDFEEAFCRAILDTGLTPAAAVAYVEGLVFQQGLALGEPYTPDGFLINLDAPEDAPDAKEETTEAPTP